MSKISTDTGSKTGGLSRDILRPRRVVFGEHSKPRDFVAHPDPVQWVNHPRFVDGIYVTDPMGNNPQMIREGRFYPPAMKGTNDHGKSVRSSRRAK